MESSRYLDCLAGDYAALRSAAVAAGPDARVPSCPEWTAIELVDHTGVTYLHKVAVMREGKWPDPWPSKDVPDDPFEALDLGYRELTAEFAARGPDEPSLTWYEPEQTVGFWIRRMAQETVVHRIDAQLAAGGPLTPVPGDLAVDGVDEVLERFLGYGSAQRPDEYATVEGGHLAGDAGTDTIVVAAGEASWTVRPTPRSVSVATGPMPPGTPGTPGASADSARARVSAAPAVMLGWLWGRAGDDVITVDGDPEWAAYLRRLLASVTR